MALSLCLGLSAGAVTGSCTWNSRSLVMGSSSWERTVLRSTPSLKSFITTPQTNCPSAEPNTCLCSSRCWCRHSEATHTHHTLTHTHTLGLTQMTTLVLHFQSHIEGSSRSCRVWFVFGVRVWFFAGAWSKPTLVRTKTQWACNDAVLMCDTHMKNVLAGL